MPIVTIEAWPLKPEQKTTIIKKVTEVFVEQGIPAQAVTIIIHETKQENWGTEGEQHSTKFKEIIEKMK